MSNEIMCVIEASPARVLRNLVVRNTSNKKIVLNIALLDRKRVIILPKGEYQFSTDSVGGSFDLQDDYKISISNNNLIGEVLVQRSPVRAFRQRNIFITNNILNKRAEYYLTIRDYKLLSLPLSAYRAEINGVNIPLILNSADNRIISENPIPLHESRFRAGASYDVTFTVNGDAAKIPPLRFQVIDPPPTINITNLWRGRPLQYAEVEYFKYDGTRTGLFELTHNVYMDVSQRAGLLSKGPNGERYIYTGSDGKIVIYNEDIHYGDKIALAVSGYVDYDPSRINQLTWYIYPLTVEERNLNPNITWNIPSKGGKRAFSAYSRVSRTWNEMEMENDYYVSLYYRPGVRSTMVSRRVVLNDPGFIRIPPTPHREINGNILLAWFDFDNICIATQINYLIRLESSRGNFSMNNITFENSSQPELELE